MSGKEKSLYDAMIENCGPINPINTKLEKKEMPNEDFVFTMKYGHNMYPLFTIEEFKSLIDKIEDENHPLHKSYPFDLGIIRDRKGFMRWHDNKTLSCDVSLLVFIKSRKSLESLCDYLEYKAKGAE